MDTPALTTSPGKPKLQRSLLRCSAYPLGSALCLPSHSPSKGAGPVISTCEAHSDPAPPSLVHPSHQCRCYYSSFLIPRPRATVSPSSHYPTAALRGWGYFHCNPGHSTSPSRIWLRRSLHSALCDLGPPISLPCSLCFLFLEYTRIICASWNFALAVSSFWMFFCSSPKCLQGPLLLLMGVSAYLLQMAFPDHPASNILPPPTSSPTVAESCHLVSLPL